MEIVPFKHDYTKLYRNIIPTIRSKEYMEKHNLKLGDTVQLESPNMKIEAILFDFEDWKLKDLELAFLQYDCHPIQCNDLTDYINLLNSFNQYDNTNEKTIKRIHWFQKKRTIKQQQLF